MKRKFIIALLLLVCVFSCTLELTACGSSSEDESQNDKNNNQVEPNLQPTEGLAYILNSDNTSYSVTGIGTATDTEIVIPSVYEDKPVTSIRYRAFRDCRNLTSIIIPNSVKSIGNNAFSCCSAITSITIPESVTSIGEWAFEYCHGLTSITIPNSVTNIGASAFSSCNHLQYNEYNNAYYLGNDTNKYVILMKAKDTSIASCAIHENTKFIYENAFYDCSSLTNIEIPNGVTSIGVAAFGGCSRLQYNTYNNAYYLGNDTNKYAWLIKAKDKSITSTMINGNTKIIYHNAFDGCSKLKSISIPYGVTRIGMFAFHDCGLTSIEIPNSVTSIGYRAFRDCGGLTSITLPDSVTTIGRAVFMNCTSLTNIAIPNSVMRIEQYMFCGCNRLTSIEIPNSIKSIESYAFSDCSRLTSITIPNSVTNFGSAVFENCSRLTRIAFNGTIEQWNAISKSNDWDKNANTYTVVCTDDKLVKTAIA